ncbi:MAG: DNA polymerase III subunit chi [Acetobacteraceae bacterium]
MTEVGFYHLTRSKVEAALPQLLERTLAAHQRAVVLCGSAERVTALDAVLWEGADQWLPHGTAADGDADLQPIWLTTDDEAPNNARFLFLIDGAGSRRLGAFERVFDLFDGTNEQAVAAARARWAAARAQGLALTYWRQTPRGWEKAGP